MKIRAEGASQVAMEAVSAGTILAIAPEGPDRAALQTALHNIGWPLSFAWTREALVVAPGDKPPAVILFDRRLPGGDWRERVRLFSRMSPRPCVILLSPTCDQNLWDELVRFGGFDVLRTPIHVDQATKVVSRAWALWRNEEQLRCGGVRNLPSGGNL